MSCKCECKFGSIKCNSNQKWNNDKCRCESKDWKEHNVRDKDYIWNPVTCSCKHGKYLGSIIDDSVIACNEIIEETVTFPTKSIPTKTVPTNGTLTSFYILLAFLSITISSLITVSICMIKYSAKQIIISHHK